MHNGLIDSSRRILNSSRFRITLVVLPESLIFHHKSKVQWVRKMDLDGHHKWQDEMSYQQDLRLRALEWSSREPAEVIRRRELRWLQEPAPTKTLISHEIHFIHIWVATVTSLSSSYKIHFQRSNTSERERNPRSLETFSLTMSLIAPRSEDSRDVSSPTYTVTRTCSSLSQLFMQKTPNGEISFLTWMKNQKRNTTLHFVFKSQEDLRNWERGNVRIAYLVLVKKLHLHPGNCSTWTLGFLTATDDTVYNKRKIWMTVRKVILNLYAQ